MSADYRCKQGDTTPIQDQLTDANGNPVNLTGATVTFVARDTAAVAPLALTGSASVIAALTGDVQFTPSAADTSIPGEFEVSWVVTASGQQATYPVQGYKTWAIEPSLTAAGVQQIVSLAWVKEYLNVPANDRSHDTKLLGYIQAATAVIEGIIGPVIVTEFDEWHDGGQYWIQLRHRPSFAIGSNPVLNLVAVEEFRGPTRYTLTEVADPSQASTYSVMLDPRIGTVYRRTTGGGVIAFGAGAWGGGMPDQVHVVYQAGQSPIPENVKEAAKELIRVNYQTTMAAGRGARTRADEIDTGPPLGFYTPRRVLELLAPMRRHPSIA